jgi:hypothetical protein
MGKESYKRKHSTSSHKFKSIPCRVLPCTALQSTQPCQKFKFFALNT